MAIAFGAVVGEVHTTGTGTTKILTTTAAVPSGAKIILGVHYFATAAMTGMAGGGLTWSIDRDQLGTSNYRCAVVSADAPSGLASGSSLTATFGAVADTARVGGCYVTGLATGASSVDTTAGNGAASGTSATANLVTGNADDFLFSTMWVDFLGAGNITPASGFTEFYDVTHADTQKDEDSYQIVAATSTYAIGGTWTGSLAWVLAGVAYKADTGGASGAATPGGKRRRVHPARDARHSHQKGHRNRAGGPGPLRSFYLHKKAVGDVVADSTDQATTGVLYAAVDIRADATHDANVSALLPAGVDARSTVSHDASVVGHLPVGVWAFATQATDWNTTGLLVVGVDARATISHDISTATNLPVGVVPYAPIVHNISSATNLPVGAVVYAPIAHNVDTSSNVPVAVSPYATIAHNVSTATNVPVGVAPYATVSHNASVVAILPAGVDIRATVAHAANVAGHLPVGVWAFTGPSGDTLTTGLLLVGLGLWAPVSHAVDVAGVLPAGVDLRAPVTHTATVAGILPAGIAPYSTVTRTASVVGYLPVGADARAVVDHNANIAAALLTFGVVTVALASDGAVVIVGGRAVGTIRAVTASGRIVSAEAVGTITSSSPDGDIGSVEASGGIGQIDPDGTII